MMLFILSTLFASTNWENEVIYYIIVDRFEDGNTRNNIPDYAYPVNKNQSVSETRQNLANRFWIRKMYDPTKTAIEYYHGGDIEGIIKKLPYLKDLGVTAILISPITDNVNGVFPFAGETSYHGYWTQDWYRINSHFGNPPELGESFEDARSGKRVVNRLVERAHSLNIKVLLDLSFNHSSPALEDETSVRSTEDTSRRSKLFQDRKYIYYLPFSPVFKKGEYLLSYCYPTENLTCKESLDPSGFFHNHDIYGNANDYDKESIKSGQLHSLPDIDQRNPAARTYLLESLEMWANFGFDGYRIDAVKHIYDDFIDDVIKTILKVNPKAMIVGEYFHGGIYNKDSVDWLKRTKNITMFDFSLATAIRNYFSNSNIWQSSPQDFANILNNTEDIPENILQLYSIDLVTFINNHDLPRFMSLPGVTYEAYHAALALLLTSRGIPKLTQGDEIASAYPYNPKLVSELGPGGDPWCRQSMEWDFFDSKETGTQHENRISIYESTKKLLALRKKDNFFRIAKTEFIKPDGFLTRFTDSMSLGPTLAFTRWIGKDSNTTNRFYYFYSKLNRHYCFSVKLQNLDYKNLLTGKYYSIKNGKLCHTFSENEVILISTHPAHNL